MQKPWWDRLRVAAAQCSVTSNTQTLLGDRAISSLAHGHNQPIKDVVDLLGQYALSSQLREVDGVKGAGVKIPDAESGFGNQDAISGVGSGT